MSYPIQPEFLLKASQGLSLQKGEKPLSSVSIDSRKAKKDQVFFALKGKYFDGHNFLQQALQKGVGAFVVSNKKKAQDLLKNKKLTVIYVPDTLQALQDLAQSWTIKMKTKVIAITGSNGKTTSRSFAQSLLSPLSPFASPKSYNNSIGVSLSLLNVDREKAFLIQEIGTNKPGEIAVLTSLCRPVCSAVTMVGPSHLEALNSLPEIAREKQEIYLKSPKADWIFNRDNIWTEKMFQKLTPSHKNFISFSSDKKKGDVSLRFVQEKARSSLIEGHIYSVQSKAQVSFSGQPNLENLMCASALALSVGLEPKQIWNLLPQCQIPEGRQEWIQIQDKNISILFDAYNANPSSMEFFLNSCERFSKANKRLLVIGDMKELGKDSEKYHRDLAKNPTLLQSRFIIFVGEHGDLLENQLQKEKFKGQIISSKNYNKRVLSALKQELKPDDFVAIKASRSLQLEQLVFDLTGRKIF